MLAAVFLSAAAIAADQESRALAGPVLLEVSGQGGAPVLRRFDRDALMALPQTSIQTYTDWTDGPQQFDGVLLVDLLDHVGVEGSVITAHALNDYYAEIPASDLSRHDILIAHTWNGERMRVRDRGPLWIIYPSNNRQSGQPDIDNSKMVWQLQKLHVSEQ